MSQDAGALDRTIGTLAARLLERRTLGGHWEGRLASSALSTATATVALMLEQRASGHDRRSLIDSGLAWLIANQNTDGGWGDTVVSFSNLSTTMLCWSALSLGVDAHESARTAIERAEGWLARQVGDLSSTSLKRAILTRYGKDRTFSAPILTVLALAGRLGPGAGAWRLVPQLPFELAACPHRWFRWMRLPVVSYALPALVAIGQVRHRHAPTRNPMFATLRSALRSRTLRIAREMQPESGGYLEAVPLTAFVVMSVVSAGAADDGIVAHGIRFLIASARADGSWPIDTNLATWVTTLSVGTLAPNDWLPDEDRRRILQWLLNQQVAHEHPFTHAKPGGWAWTDLAGGVPDADDTAGALLAIWTLGGVTQLNAAVAGIEYRSAPDLTAHALEAWSIWYPAVASDLQRRISEAAERGALYLAQDQRPDGSWAPLWFGNQHVAGEVNLTYGTARVIGALAASLTRHSSAAERSRGRGLTWLLNAQNSDGGWGGAGGAPSSIEETGVALHALGRNADHPSPPPADAMRRGVRWLLAATEEGRRTPASPIGLYFARLWYYEELYPLVLGLQGLAQVRAAMTLTPS